MATSKKPLADKTPAAKPAPSPKATAKAAKPAKRTAPVKPAAKAPPQGAAKSVPKPVAKPKADKAPKEKKPKLVRDSFTIPKAEYAVLDELKARAGKLGRPVKKSELLRAGIKALAAMADGDYLKALAAVPAIKTGRPSAT